MMEHVSEIEEREWWRTIYLQTFQQLLATGERSPVELNETSSETADLALYSMRNHWPNPNQ